MALTIRDCCALPSLSMAQVVAGHRGLDRPVDSISVLEWMDLRSVQTQFFLQNEVVITSFYSFRHDVDAQLLAVRRLRESGEVGMILYYVGLILPQVDPRLIRLADELEFPIIMMPPGQMNLRYSEAIREVSEQIQSSRAREPDFAHFILERLASVPEMHRSVSTVLRLLSDHLQMTLVLCDSQFGEYISATWPRSLAVSVRGVMDAYTQDQEGAQGYSVSGCQPVDNTKWRGAQLLAITPQDTPAEADRVAQAAQVVELAAKLWKSYEFDTYSVDLIAAVINEELSEVRRLLRRRGQAEFPYDTLWLLAPRQMPEEYKKRTVLLAAQLKAMRAALEERGIRGHAAILDERIAVILQCAPQDGLALLAELSGEGFFGIQLPRLNAVADFHRAYARAMAVMEPALRLYARRHPIAASEVQFLEDLLTCCPPASAMAADGLHILAPLLGKGKADDLLETLGAYFIDCGANADQTAEQLYLHRNTVKYRLQKAEDMLGFPLSRYPEQLLLYRALALLRLQEKA